MKQKYNTIHASIVVCTYNGEKNIATCLQSLLDQNYPKDAYEIILVDDGSTDNTGAVVSTFPITVLRHTVNRGLSVARNTGLEQAKGKIYICFDDDCIADKNWLRELLKAYTTKTAGVCGYTRNSTSGLIDRFLSELGHGNPSPIIDGGNTHPLQRIMIYLKTMYNKAGDKTKSDIYIVNEIWGENCSFPVNILKKINGWNEKLSGVEDTDLCQRIKAVTNDPFICTKKAIIYHDGELTFFQLLKKPFMRGYAILRFYIQNHKIPPLYPFPFIILGVAGFLVFLYGLPAFITLLIAPQLFYFWWLIKYLKTGKSYYLLFSYIQLSLETSSLLGLLSGYVQLVLDK